MIDSFQLNKIRLLIAFAAVLILACISYALLPHSESLLSATAATETVTGSWVRAGRTVTGIKEQHHFALATTYNSGTGTCDVKIQVSPDCVTAYDLPNGSFTQVTTTSKTEYKVYDSALYDVPACIRAVATLAGTDPDYDIELTWIHD